MAGGLSVLLTAVILSAQRVLPNPLWGPQGMGRNIRQLPCVSRKSGEAGICMFAFSCAKMNGTHLGTCIDRFYFGSCCKLPGNEGELDVAPPFVDNHLDTDGSSTTQRIRPAITQKPFSSRPSTTTWSSPTSGRPPPTNTTSIRPIVSSTIRPFSSSTNRPVISSTIRPSSSTTNRPTNIPTSTSRPAGSTTPRPANIQPSTWVTNNVRPTAASTRPPISTWPSSTSTSTSPTLVTWTSLEEGSRPSSLKPQAQVKPTAGTHKPTPVTGSVTVATPTKRPPSPSKPLSTPKPTSRPSSKPSINSTVATKPPAVKPTKPVRPATSTARPATATSKPQSTTWIPVSVTTHAPSTPSKKPITTKKPISPVQTKPSTTESSGTSRPNPSSSSSTRPVTSTTSQPVTITSPRPVTQGVISSTNRPQYPEYSGSTAIPTSPSKPPRPISTTNRPVAEASTATSPIPISSSRPPISSTQPPQVSSTSQLPSSSSSSWVTIDASTSGPSSTSKWPSSTAEFTSPSSTPSGIMTSSFSSSTLPLVSQTPSTIITMGTTESAVSASSSTIATSSTPLPDINEVESFNMTNYKDVCGRRLFPEARVVGGQLSGFGKWPWQISLRQWRTSTYLHKCGAALLSENWAITAAHCVENVPPSDLLLRLGEHDLSTEEEPYGFQERRVQIVASHPQFDPRTFEYDLALLRFYEPVSFQPNIIPVCVPEDDTNFVGSMAFVTGWGRLYEDGPLPSILQEVSVPVINNTICETMYKAAGYIEHIPDIFICAGWKKGGFDSCEGDSGGPMVIQRPDRRWLLAGVISWGIGCAEPNQPGVYTRISQFRHWINQILQF